jgi:cytochrome c2
MTIWPTVLAAAFVAATVRPVFAADDLKRGEELLQQDCGKCHAIGRAGESPDKEAPEFQFDVDDVGAIIAYLKSIQQR